MTTAAPLCSLGWRMLCLWFHKTKFSINLSGSKRSTASAGISVCVCLALRPKGAFSEVGPAEWEGRIRSYRLEFLIMCEQVYRCCREKRDEDVCVYVSVMLSHGSCTGTEQVCVSFAVARKRLLKFCLKGLKRTFWRKKNQSLGAKCLPDFGLWCETTLWFRLIDW